MPANLPDRYLNSSAKNIINHQTIKQWKNYNILKNIDISDNLTAALIIPDGNPQSPTYLVFDNYEKILKWNRSLRFALSVCSLANMIRNEI
jgi:membrane-bound lytic murein transglycosylase B